MSQLAVAVNKIDSAEFSQDRFLDITKSLRTFLKTAGFKESDVMYIPCSGLTGENLIKRESQELESWYTGPTLLQAIGSYLDSYFILLHDKNINLNNQYIIFSFPKFHFSKIYIYILLLKIFYKYSKTCVLRNLWDRTHYVKPNFT